MDIEIRTIAEDEFEAFFHALEVSFSGAVRPEDLARERLVTETDRTLVALDEGRMVGGAVAVSFRFRVPGGAEVPAAGVTAVGVQPTHRRRGINTALMRAQLDDVHARGEPIAVLYASEGGIYESFGYGLAVYLGEIDLEVERSAFVRGYRRAGRVRLLSRGDALPLMRRVYDRAQLERPGMIAMSDPWWEWLFFPGEEEKDEPMFFALHDADGESDGFAAYRVKQVWTDSIPQLELSVRRLIATSPEAYADLWRFLFDIDLVSRVRAWNRPIDESLLQLMQEPRRLRFRVSDGLRVRLVDVAAALAARGYIGDGRIVIQVEDAFCPWNEGRYALDVTDGVGTYAPTRDEPEIVCSATELGAVYLGGNTFRQLHRAGRVAELSQGALARADALVASDPVPWSAFIF